LQARVVLQEPLFLFLITALFESARAEYFDVVLIALLIVVEAELAWQSSLKYESSLSYSYYLIKLFRVIQQYSGIFDLPHQGRVLINLSTVPRKQIDLPKVLYLCRSCFLSPIILFPCLNTPFSHDLILD